MITIEEIRDYIETFNFGADMYSVGQIDGEKQKIIACFEVDSPDEEQTPFDVGCHFQKTIDLFIHWTDDFNETDRKANEIYKTMFRKYNFYVPSGKHISYIIVNPVRDQYKDKYGIYNRSIRIKFIQ